MRKSILLPLLLIACSGDRDQALYRPVPDFVDRSTPVACEAVDLAAVPDELRTASDTSFLVLDAARRLVTEFADDLRPLWTLEYQEQGPAAVQRPVSATLLGDTAVAIASRGGLRLVVLHRSGRLVRVQPLDFVPGTVAAAGDEVLITAVPLGGSPGSLLFRYRGAGLEPVPVPPRAYQDMTVGALGNSTLVETDSDGAALVAHRFFAPRAFRIAADRDTVYPLAGPVPDALEPLVDAVPRPPITEDQFDRILVPAMAMSIDRGSGEVFILTRSGRMVEGRRERAILRLAPELDYRASYLLDVHAVSMALLPRREAAIVADDFDHFFLCPLDADNQPE